MREKILNILQDSNDYISGEKISSVLGISRSAVWKNINTLREQGYEIESVKHHGYKLKSRAGIFSAMEIKNSFSQNKLLQNMTVEYYSEIDSTNLAARRKVDYISENWQIFVADKQTHGRGRLGRKWVSEPASGLWFSIMFRPDSEAMQIANITLFAGLCVQKALTEIVDSEIAIKWPNDLVAMPSGKKICGILTETVFEDMLIKAVIIGIGINVNNTVFEDEIKNKATSLRLETGKEYDRLRLLEKILQVMTKDYPLYSKKIIGERPVWLQEYKDACATIGRDIVIKKHSGETLYAKAVDLSENGDLIAELSDGSKYICQAGEVSVRGLLGYT